jgi:BASS family bile acid:Na+ symporter
MDTTIAPEHSINNIIIGVFAITTVPVIIGMMVNHYAPTFARKFERFSRIIAIIIFVVIIVGAIAAERANVVEYIKQAGPVTLSLNLIMMAVAHFVAGVGRLGDRQKIAITLECGLQNGTLAIFVAATLIGSNTMMVPGAIYSLLMFPTAIVYVFIVMKSRT